MSSAISTHNQLYRKEKIRIIPIVISEKELEKAGPKIGKRKIYSNVLIPNVKEKAPAAIMLNLDLRR